MPLKRYDNSRVGLTLDAGATPKELAIETPPEWHGGDKEFLLDSKFCLEAGLHPRAVYRNSSPALLYEKALKYGYRTHISNCGALVTVSGNEYVWKTGRSPKDKRVVREASTEQDIWWNSAGSGSPNYEMDERTFLLNRESAIQYLNTLDRVFVTDGYANWHTGARLKVRVIAERSYHALFMQNMLIRPAKEELADWGEPDFVIYNAGAFPANRYANYMTSSTSVCINLKSREMVILGTEYAGEMKKGVFSILHYLMPKQGVLSLHSGCNIGHNGDLTLFFGLSGTGKTTLSTDPQRPLIGDDEHCWGDDGVWNIEGGCYAKCIGLEKDKEPEIWKAIRYGAILENVVYNPETSVVDYTSNVLTENTRACYPIEYIDNARIPCTGPHPRNIILLCYDAYGVLPPVSRLTHEQAMYHFISGYTSKAPGTEVGIVEPESTFSACYGGAFLMWHPMKYAAMLATKMREHGTDAWLLNTGYCGGRYGVGRRMSLAHTRAIVDAIHNGSLLKCEYDTFPIFNLQVPTTCPNVPDNVLHAENDWADKTDFQRTLRRLAGKFVANFKVFLADAEQHVGTAMAQRILSGGPSYDPEDLVQAETANKA